MNLGSHPQGLMLREEGKEKQSGYPSLKCSRTGLKTTFQLRDIKPYPKDLGQTVQAQERNGRHPRKWRSHL